MPLPKAYTREDFDRLSQKYFELTRKFDRVESRVVDENEYYGIYHRLQDAVSIVKTDDGNTYKNHWTMERLENRLEDVERRLVSYKDETKEDFDVLKELFEEQSKRAESIKDRLPDYTQERISWKFLNVSKSISLTEKAQVLGADIGYYTAIISPILDNLVETEKLILGAEQQKPVPAGVDNSDTTSVFTGG